jgi:prepilin signal peptidase PulO-like enzyme (type II secretory pathway)
MVVLSIALTQSSLLVHQSLLSSLIGMALGGFTVWIVRWIAGLAIGMEALGFGDVTLMAMVGAFVGWQPVVVAFFVSPMLAIVFVVIRYLITGDNQTPFGPYLCAGVLVTILAWDRIWNQYFQDLLFVVGPFLFQILFGSLLLMGAMLWIWRLVKQTLLSRS